LCATPLRPTINPASTVQVEVAFPLAEMSHVLRPLSVLHVAEAVDERHAELVTDIRRRSKDIERFFQVGGHRFETSRIVLHLKVGSLAGI